MSKIPPNMSTKFFAVTPINDEYAKMAAVYHACVAAGIEIPSEADKFFDYQAPESASGSNSIVKEIHGFDESFVDDIVTFEIDLSTLPKTAKRLRIVNNFDTDPNDHPNDNYDHNDHF